MSDLVVVVGGGPAGMMAAYAAASHGKEVVLLEKNTTLGKKLLITGKGRCNITNNCDISEFIQNVPVNGSFLYSAFYGFTNAELIALLERTGLSTKVERGGRIFPISDRAADVLTSLKILLRSAGVKVISAKVTEIRDLGAEKEVIVNGNRMIRCTSVIVATGGLSYPTTGSTGDGYAFAKAMGHKVTELKASLVPLIIKSKYIPKLMGLSLKNTAIRVFMDGKEIYNDFGEMLFTHYGASGPVILSASSHMRDFVSHSYEIAIDLKPALDYDALDKRILRDFEKYKNKNFANSLGDLLPKKLIPVIVEMSGISPETKVNEIKREQRKALGELLKGMRFKVDGLRPIEGAIITSGGIDVKQINPKTMESKLVVGLYFAGEIIDLDAYTGGFNLQIAFSTGYLAGKSAAES